MENNLIDQAKRFITPDVISKLSARLGETHESVEKGFQGGIPSIFLGLLNNAEGGGLASILDKAKSIFAGGNISDAVTNLHSSEEYQPSDNHESLINQIFGDKLSTIVSSIASFSGLKDSSVHQLLGSSTPAAFGALAQSSSGWDLSSIKNSLLTNKGSFLSAIPAGLGLSGLGNLVANVGDSIKDKVSSVTEGVKEHVNIPPLNTPKVNYQVEESKSSSPWKIIIPLIIILGLLYLFFTRGCTNKDTTAVVTEEYVDTITVNEAPVTNVRESFKVVLPNGVEINAFKGGIEDQLVNFLKSDYQKLGTDSLKKIWFDFDNLNFETGSATITKESQPQLDNLAEILKAFPNAKVKIGGYTDKTGDESINKKISAERAAAVKTFLTNAGHGAQVVEAEGYGSEFAKFPADASEENRVTDRRVSVNVR